MLIYKNKVTINRDIETVYDYFSKKETLQLFLDDIVRANEIFVFEEFKHSHIDIGYVYNAKFSTEEFVANVSMEIVDMIPNRFYKYEITYEFIEDKTDEDDVESMNEFLQKLYPSMFSTVEFIPKSEYVTTIISNSYIQTPNFFLKIYFKTLGLSWAWKDRKLYQSIKRKLENQ